MTFKIGDKVEVVERYNKYKVGEVGTITSTSSDTNPYYRINGDTWGALARNFKKVEVEDMYEDGWILNDGKVTIPDDAQKSMHEGSVVAFRKRKVIPLVFGDELTSGSSTYKFIRYTDSKKDRVDIFNPDTNSLLPGIFLNLLNRK